MAHVHTFNVTPSLPTALQPLLDLAYDMAWSWHPEARRLFRRMDRDLWVAVNGNPVALLGRLGQDAIEALAKDSAFLSHMESVRAKLQEEADAPTWFGATFPDRMPKRARGKRPASGGDLIAYFCTEFGLSEALPIYSGGLGVLAGDHLKSAQDLGIPLVGIGMAYQDGYFRQLLNPDGWQQEDPYDNDFAVLPMKRAVMPNGEKCAVWVDIEGRPVKVRVWTVKVGRVTLLLLDTNSPSNSPEDRRITAQLYGGASDMRIRQEIVLGFGGSRALDALGLRPTVFHMNEGHSAFLALERIRKVVADGARSFEEARELLAASNVFTTHTPVPAGFDIFSVAQMDRYLPGLADQLHTSRERLYALGAHEGDTTFEKGFNMAYLALRTAGRINAVSQLHGDVSREMWRRMWPGFEASDVPIVGLTNGIHTQTWLSTEMARLLEHYLGRGYHDRPSDPTSWGRVERIPDAELWRAHERARDRLVGFVRARHTAKLKRHGATEQEFTYAKELLDPNVLTIGFARRFATYKRATLLLKQKGRLQKLLTDPERPIQIIFAGKAHPRDTPGKELIREIVHFARSPEVRRRIVFLEEYDMGVARRLVQGVDVWLNTPRRPKEASGTSGMKVVANGGLNLSILDGWWAEAYDGTNGWAIGAGENYADLDTADAIEANLLLDLLENHVVPEFYDRGVDRIPRQWIGRMKRSIGGLSAQFSTDRMLKEYAEKLYVPAMVEAQGLRDDEGAAARDLAGQVGRLQRGWSRVHVGDVTIEGSQDMALGQSLNVTAPIFLGDVPPEDVVAEIHGGRVDAQRHIVDGAMIPMTVDGVPSDGWYTFKGCWTPAEAGHSGCTVRVRPRFERDAPVRGLGARAWGDGG